jgi:hypothetical protein
VLGCQEPTHRLTPRAHSTLGPDAIELAEIAGVQLDPFQKLFLNDSLGVTAAGKWASLEVALELSRQNGKSALFEVRALAGLFLFRERLIVYTAHKGETAMEAFRRIDDLIDSEPELKAEVKRVSRTNGKESIELHSRQRVAFRTRTTGGGRGLTGDVVFLDEAQDLDDDHVAALLPLMFARPNSQLWYAGSAGDERSVVLGRLVKRMLKREPKLTMHRFASDEDVDPTDPQVIARVNPAVGRRIDIQTLLHAQRSMGVEKFAREVLGIGSYPRDEGEDWVIPRSAWERTIDEDSEPVGKVVFAVEVKWDRQGASVSSAGWREDRTVHGELIKADVGTRWVAPFLAERLRRNPNFGVVLDPGGPAGSLLGELRDAGIEPTLLKTSDVTQGWGWFYDACTGEPPQFRHRGAPILTGSLAVAATRKIGDSTTWRRQASGDVTPLLSVTWAAQGLRLLSAVPEKRKAPAPRSAGRGPVTAESLTADLARGSSAFDIARAAF